MRGSSDTVGLLLKGLLLGMSFGAAIYGDARGGAAAGLVREAAKALAPAQHGRGGRGRRG